MSDTPADEARRLAADILRQVAVELDAQAEHQRIAACRAEDNGAPHSNVTERLARSGAFASAASAVNERAAALAGRRVGIGHRTTPANQLDLLTT